MVSSDITAVTLTANGEVKGSRSRVREVYVKSTEDGDSPKIELRDGGAAGETRLSLALHARQAGCVAVPDGGILFKDSVYLTLTDCDSVTVFMS